MKKNRSFCLAVLLTLALNACANSETIPCKSNEECNHNEICADGTCIPPNDAPPSSGNSPNEGKICTTHDDCKTGMGQSIQCIQGHCRTQSTPLPSKTCASKFDCEDGSGKNYECIDKKCVPQTKPGDSSQGERACASKFDCEDGSGKNYECVDKKCVPQTKPGDSSQGERACASKFDCEDGSGKNYECVDKKCVSQTKPGDSTPSAEPVCGDGKINAAGEVCDRTDLGGKTCKTLGKNYYGGALACAKTCLEFDESACMECDLTDDKIYACDDPKVCKAGHCVEPTCGNGTKDPGEVCDHSDLGGKTCADLDGFADGILKCSESCHWDTSECTLMEKKS